MSFLKMRTLATAMTLGTPHGGKLTNEHIWKFRFEFGPGGAPRDDAAQTEKLREEYKEVAAAVNDLGYNGDMLDVVPRVS